MDAQRKRKLIALSVYPGLALLLFGSEIYQRCEIELTGTIVSSETSCVQPQNNRCATTYIVEDSSQRRHTYLADPNSHSLPRRLPIGTSIIKNKWALGYSLDGRYVDDYPLWFEVWIVVFAFCGGWWLHLRSGVNSTVSSR